MSRRAKPTRFWKEPFNWLLVAVPIAVVLEFLHFPALWIFVFSSIAIIPLAGLMGRATENLAESMGAGIGGLLNATFGNAAELIIALMLLHKGPEMYPLVKASLTGSIIGNVLLVLGISMVAGGLKNNCQKFNRTAAGMGSTLLMLATTGLIMPAIYYHLFYADDSRLSGQDQTRIVHLSEEIAVVLAITYGLSLVFSLGTHRNLFTGQEEKEDKTPPKTEWSRKVSLIVLLSATGGVALISEFLVGSVESAAHALGMNRIFVGVVVVAVIGNAAEHSTAVLVAMKNKMDLAMNVAVGSSIQVALFVAPVLVFASLFMGHGVTLDLHFTILETVAIILSVIVLAMVCLDGESHWMEGVMLLAIYIILALAFYHMPEATQAEAK